MSERHKQREYWQSAKYRRPEHPVVAAYVEPKLRFIDTCVNLRNVRILDVGCGNGVFAYYLKNRYGCAYTGTDISPFMLKKNPIRPCLISNSLCLPFADNTFPLVFAANLLHHVSDPDRAVAEMARVAKHYVALVEPNALNPVMFGFSLAVQEERGGLRSLKNVLVRRMKKSGLMCVAGMTTGMISQNNTPARLVPLLKLFDVDFPFGEYHVLVGKKTNPGNDGDLC